MSESTRREFLAMLAAAGMAAASTGWFSSRLWAMAEEGSLPKPRGPGKERWVPTLCRLCPAGCGIRVRLVDGLPVGLEGDKTNPLSAGGLCPAGFVGLQELVHPDRIRSPMHRDGPRGSGRWRALSWDEALERIAEPLRAARAAGRPQAFAVLERGDSPLTRFWLERVLRAFGSPNLLLGHAGEPWHSAWAYVAGLDHPPAPDLPNADFVVCFGYELLETEGHPVWQTKNWGRLRAPDAPRRGTAAYVGPRFSPTARHADLRVAVRPGTEGILALGLIHVLILEDLVDRPFLERWTSGYGGAEPGQRSGRIGFESFIRSGFDLEKVSQITGAGVSEIFRLGRAFGLARRPLALAGSGALEGEAGFSTAMAVIALNLAVGSVGRSGGWVPRGGAPLSLPPAREPDDLARTGLAAARVDGAGTATLPVVSQSPGRLAANLAAKTPYPLDVLVVHGVNPVFEWPDRKASEAALDNVGLLAVVGTVEDETAHRADIVLPEASFLESWQLLPQAIGIPADYVGLQQPAVDPVYQSRAFEDMWFDLARKVGGPAAAAVPEGDYASWLPSAVAGLFAAGRGTISGGPFHARIAGFMEDRGWKPSGPGTAQAFWDELRRSGSWIDVPRPEHLPTELLEGSARRFDFWPPRLYRDIELRSGVQPAPDAPYRSAEGQAPADAGKAADFPLRLLLFDTNALWRGRTALTPLLLEMSGFREDIGWDSWVEIHPETARRNRIESGDRVRLDSPYGSIRVRAHVAPIVPPDAVAVPRGLGHTHYGRFATGVGANPLALLPSAVDPWTGSPVAGARVRLSRGRA
jgi:anaerobic selenocysteine-containing dehydrogenase